MIFWAWTRKILELPYWTQINFMMYWSLDLKSTQTTLTGFQLILYFGPEKQLN